MPQAKVFRLNDYEWWAGYDLESVKAHYLKATGIDEDEAFDDPHELTDEELDTLRFIEDPYDEIGSGLTFREVLAKLTEFPCLFATTEV